MQRQTIAADLDPELCQKVQSEVSACFAALHDRRVNIARYMRKTPSEDQSALLATMQDAEFAVATALGYILDVAWEVSAFVDYLAALRCD